MVTNCQKDLKWLETCWRRDEKEEGEEKQEDKNSRGKSKSWVPLKSLLWTVYSVQQYRFRMQALPSRTLPLSARDLRLPPLLEMIWDFGPVEWESVIYYPFVVFFFICYE